MKLPTRKCTRCNYEWIPRTPDPVSCPKCHSPYWNRKRKNGVKQNSSMPPSSTSI